MFVEGCCLVDNDTVEFLLDRILIFGIYPTCSSLIIGYTTDAEVEELNEPFDGGVAVKEFFLYLEVAADERLLLLLIP